MVTYPSNPLPLGIYEGKGGTKKRGSAPLRRPEIIRGGAPSRDALPLYEDGENS
jgi:hypothetical protein